MKIVVLNGSPNIKGSTNILIDAFSKGAKEAGHSVDYFDIPHLKIHPCFGCVKCGYNSPCVQNDDMTMIKESLLTSDMIVLATPLYYYGFSAQLKTVIDRFCAFNMSLQRKNLKSALIAVSWNDDDWTMQALKLHYETLVKYLNFNDVGQVLGVGCGTPAMTENSEFVKRAYEFGRNI